MDVQSERMKFHRQLVWERLQIERERMDMEKTKA